MKKQKIICVVGPTASGKTGLGIAFMVMGGLLVAAGGVGLFLYVKGKKKPMAEEVNEQLIPEEPLI